MNIAVLSSILKVNSQEKVFDTASISFKNNTGGPDIKGYLQNLPDQISPDYFSISNNGFLNISKPINSHFINEMHSRNIKVIPFVSNHLSYISGEHVFEHCEELTDSITSIVRNNNLDGINVNIVNISDNDRNSLTEFVRLLRVKIGNEKTVAVTVYIYSDLLNFRKAGVYDMQNLAVYADYLLISPCYSYFRSDIDKKSTDLPDVEKTIQYTLNTVPKSKLVLAISFINNNLEAIVSQTRLVNKFDIKGMGYLDIVNKAEETPDYYLKSSDSFCKNVAEADTKTSASTESSIQEKKYEKDAFLTFDDGPDAIVTPKILDVLKENNVKATFFVNGVWVQKYPELVKRMSEEGHTVGNHTFSHKNGYIYKSWANLKAEIDKTNNLIYKETGKKCFLFRAPGGSKPYLSKEYINGIHKMGLKVFDWNCDPKDWKSANNKSCILASIKKAPVNKNLIILLHSRQDRKTTLEALPAIIQYLRSKEYNLVPITEDTKEHHF